MKNFYSIALLMILLSACSSPSENWTEFKNKSILEYGCTDFRYMTWYDPGSGQGAGTKTRRICVISEVRINFDTGKLPNGNWEADALADTVSTALDSINVDGTYGTDGTLGVLVADSLNTTN